MHRLVGVVLCSDEDATINPLNSINQICYCPRACPTLRNASEEYAREWQKAVYDYQPFYITSCVDEKGGNCRQQQQPLIQHIPYATYSPQPQPPSALFYLSIYLVTNTNTFAGNQRASKEYCEKIILVLMACQGAQGV